MTVVVLRLARQRKKKESRLELGDQKVGKQLEKKAGDLKSLSDNKLSNCITNLISYFKLINCNTLRQLIKMPNLTEKRYVIWLVMPGGV